MPGTVNSPGKGPDMRGRGQAWKDPVWLGFREQGGAGESGLTDCRGCHSFSYTSNDISPNDTAWVLSKGDPFQSPGFGEKSQLPSQTTAFHR